MTLYEAIAAELPYLRSQAESRMVSRVAVMRKTGLMDQDETTGLEVPQWATVHSDLPFRLDGGSTGDGGSRTVTIAGVAYEQATAVGHLPATTTNLADGDLLDIHAGEWAGTTWQIVKAIVADQKTARRVPIEGVTRPSEWEA